MEFRSGVNHEQTRVMELSSSENHMWQCQRVSDGRSDRQTDRQTGEFTIVGTALYIASYADALEQEAQLLLW